ncbi:MAG: glycosyltransferase family 4 protein [Candidatus Bathyarchaeota archaeon]|nr:glycosyltransferase family 4 protein [Candidatus Bathyarchaeota archaeon]
MRRLKIAFLTEFFYPHIGGCEKRFYEITRRLAAKNHDVHVFTIQYDDDLPTEEVIEGIKVHRYSHSQSYISQDSFRSLEGILRYSLSSFRRLRKTDFELYYSNQWPMLHSIFVKPVATPLIQEWCEVWDRPLRAIIMQKLLRKVGDYHVAVSEFTKQRLINNLKINPEKIVLITNGVDTAKFGGDNKKIWGRIIYVGRLVPHKRVELLIDAFREVKKKIPQAELHIIGSGLCIQSIKNKAKGIENCFIHGFLPEKQMIELVKTAWMFVLPSEREGSGISSMEAMAAGVPFITLDYPNNAAKELCQLDCGVLVQPNEKAIASAIIQLFNDPPRWQKLSNHALNTAKKHEWNTIANQMETFFQTVVNNPEK